MTARMRKQLQLLATLPLYLSMRATGRPRLRPVSVTVSLLYACNSRCQTCRVYEKSPERLSFAEIERVFASLGDAPFWFTMSGGEPFLRPDIAEICISAYDHCHPAIMNIPTNGSLSDVIPGRVQQILAHCRDMELIINVSFDQIGEKHNILRGLPESFERALTTYRELKQLTQQYANLTVGIHTVISRFNVRDLPAIYTELQRLKPDSYITEIAEQRVELQTMDCDIAPSLADYTEAINFLTGQIQLHAFAGVSKITQAFRVEYYRLVQEILTRRTQVIPCYAGIMSVQISPQGDVWPCCVRADVMGNLPAQGYDFEAIWQSAEAARIRRSIAAKECFCPLANASYTNILCSPTAMLNVLRHVIR